MRKTEKSKKKRLATIKRGLKRNLRLNASRSKVALKRKKLQEAKKLHNKKMTELMDKILASRFKQ